MGLRVNIACGDTFLKEWNNLDYAPFSSNVIKANLLEKLPFNDCDADVVYSSHFFEHIPRENVLEFLKECYRITKLGGRIRLVLPDLEELCQTYLECRKNEFHEQADFLILETIDQCVRKYPGGELGAYYSYLQNNPENNREMINYVKVRTGHHINTDIDSTQYEGSFGVAELLRKVKIKAEKLYCNFILKLLPSAFRSQNVSFTTIGEKHAWMYDFYTIYNLLENAGFSNIEKLTATTSRIKDFPFYPLDIYKDGSPRKGNESMYVEAMKP